MRQPRNFVSVADPVRADFLTRLRSRRPELEAMALVRVDGVSDPREVADPEYVEGLRAAVSAAFDYGFAAVERGERSAPSIPIALRTQARLAARNAISLDTVLRRCFAGYTLFGDFLVEEAEKGERLPGAELKRLLGTQSALFDRVIAAVSDEYNRELEDRPNSSEQRRAEHVKRLLGGEELDSTELAYDLDACHVAAIAAGPQAAEAIRGLVNPSDHRLLLVRRDAGKVWVWIGARRGFEPEWLERLASEKLPSQVYLAIGEPDRGLAGWRLSHRQARAALPIAQRNPGSLIRYADVALLASVLQDDLFATSLRSLYLVPLEEERDGGEVLRETLRAYFTADRNASSAAAALGVSRHTVANRLRVAEILFGCPLSSVGAQIEAALCLHDLEASVPGAAAASHGR